MPVVNQGGRCVGIITESDLVIPDEERDLHLPHYISVFGGLIFLEPLKRFEERVRKAFASTARDMMTRDPDTVDADATVNPYAVSLRPDDWERDGLLGGEGMTLAEAHAMTPGMQDRLEELRAAAPAVA